jgi:hypothetical protein
MTTAQIYSAHVRTTHSTSDAVLAQSARLVGDYGATQIKRGMHTVRVTLILLPLLQQHQQITDGVAWGDHICKKQPQQPSLGYALYFGSKWSLEIHDCIPTHS